ncbi:hemolysin family protein [Methanobrevibacter olleyae]|uniref:Putative hemolysin n=1 Tax=Methanobrevibacter olleyae TaxID=294671 RepID=A0A126R1X0_METOL|nr:hemolysin family protein [Methanobrevibacter olleyae]AMK15959.1 hypothetical protein YLM1_1402 [Methanobrevibacter olleyae]SFL16295.1 putative hemolysin [Methanobrevibacter olleyae]
MDSIIIGIEILIIAILIILNGLLSLAEIAVVSARRIKIQKIADEGDKRAITVLDFMNHVNEFLSTVQVGITFVAIITGALGGSTFSEPLGIYLSQYIPYSYQVSFIIIILITTYFTILIGEIVPKRMALNDPEAYSLQTAKFMQITSFVCKPVVRLLDGSTNFALKLVGSEAREDIVTEEEVKLLIEEGIEYGTIAEEEEDIIKRVFRLDNQKVDMIMTPRSEIIWLNLEDKLEENKEKIINSKRSIFPVAEEELDDFIGVVQAKDILSKIFEGKDVDIKSNVKSPLVVPESMLSMDLLKEFKENREYVHMVLVVDEFGSVVGLITLNDLLEGIVGDIPGIDEIDNPKATQRKDNSWLIDGRFSIEDFKDLFEIEKEMPNEVEDGYTTIAGFILSHAGKIPETGEIFHQGEFTFEIVDMDANHIDKILVTINKEDKHKSDTESKLE